MADARVLADLSDKVSVRYAFDGSTAVKPADLMYYDSDDVKPAASQTDQTSEELNQRLFAKNFAGVAGEGKRSTDTDAVAKFPVHTDIVGEYDCPSSTWEVGDLVGVDEASSGTALENQKLVKVTDESLAIGYCVQREASAVTRVRARLKSAHVPDSVNPVKFLVQPSGSNVETLAANKTLSAADAPIQVLDPGGSGRDVTLPAESLKLAFWIHNSADAAEVLTVKDDGGSTVCTPTQNEAALVVSDGTTYRGIVGNSN